MVSPTELKSKAEELEDVNWKFRTFLKNRADEKELDRQFMALHNELFKNYDCGSCRNCCKEYGAVIKEDEVEPIAASLKMNRDDFFKKYAATPEDGGYELEGIPCCFYGDDDICQIEECKPRSCIEYPYTNKPERLWSLIGIVQSASVCPVVFEILERLRETYGFRTRW